MTVVVRPDGARSVAASDELTGSSRAPRSTPRREPLWGRAVVGVLAVLGMAASASAAVVISPTNGGPSYTPPGGPASPCTFVGKPNLVGGATMSCTGLNLSASRHLYYGIKVNSSVFGEAMDSSGPAGGEIFHFSTKPTANSIQYTGTTQIFNDLDTSDNSGVPQGFGAVSTRVTVTYQSGTGTLIDDATTQSFNNTNGDVRALWQITTSGFTVTIVVEAFNGSTWVTAGPFFDAVHTRDGTDQELDHVDMGFYYSTCGDGALDTSAPQTGPPTGESCDAGASNGNQASCCTTTCTFMDPSTVCRAAGGVCDLVDFCTGVSTTCADAKSTSVCRGVAGVCDLAESCDGVTNNCPADGFKSNAVTCRAAAGVCDHQENCTGSGAACPADTKLGTTTTCRAAAGICDVAEVCPGNSDNCPGDAFQPSTFVCRGSAGVCDVVEACTGGGPSCPNDTFLPSTATCRTIAGPCDVAEQCPGNGATCPADGFQPTSTVCRAVAGTCDIAENCPGTGSACPADAVLAVNTLCRAVAGVCDVEEDCTGTSGVCPTDVFQPSTFECRASGGICDPAESCTGTGADCPADAKQPTTVPCRAAAGICDIVENCDGVNDACPTDLVLDPTNTCRAAVDVCDLPESCNGVDASCPADAVAPDTTLCRGAAGVCDLADNCDGSTTACPADLKSTDVCRPVAGICDVQEVCDGVSNDCPADTFQASTLPCRGVAGDCDVAESCTGSSAACPADTFKPSSVVCRPANVAACDVAENCTGTAASCPADTVVNEGAGCAGVNNNTCLNTCRSGACQVETQANCCGNGIAEAGESCDDGNQSTALDVCPTDPADPNKCTYSTLIRGERKNPTKDKYGCQVEWFVVNPNNLPDKFALPDKDQTCHDGDPSCDADGVVNGSCRFQVVACVNTNDPSLTCLQPGNGISSIIVTPLTKKIANQPGIGPTYLADINLVTTALTPPGALHDPQGADGYNGLLPLPQASATHKDICSAPMNLDVFVAALPKDKATRRLTIKTKSKDNSFPRPKAKRAQLRLLCLP